MSEARWIAGWNTPGYLPDNPPEEFDNEQDAREYMASIIESDPLAVDCIIRTESNKQIAKHFREAPSDLLDWTITDCGRTTCYFVTKV
jgi:hypothetical protein